MGFCTSFAACLWVYWVFNEIGGCCGSNEMAQYMCVSVKTEWLLKWFLFILQSSSPWILKGNGSSLDIKKELGRKRLTIKVHGSGAVGVDFLNHNVQLVVGQLIVQLSQDFTQASGGDVTIALLVVQAESFAQFLLHSLSIFLNNELGGQLNEFVELQTTRF